MEQTTGALYQPLGDWVVHSIHTQRQQHFSYLLRDSLWIRIALGYMSCTYIAQTFYRETSDVVAWEDLPDDAAPTEAHLLGEGRRHLAYQGGHESTSFPPNIDSGDFLSIHCESPRLGNRITTTYVVVFGSIHSLPCPRTRTSDRSATVLNGLKAKAPLDGR